MISPVNGKLDLDVANWVLKERFSKLYGWTPSQIDAMPWKTIEIYAALNRGYGRKREQEAKEMKMKSRRR